MLLVDVSDGSGVLLLRFFHFNPSMQQRLIAGARLRCFAEVRRGPISLEMVHPEISFLDQISAQTVEESLTPVYPTTEGLHQNQLRKLLAQALRWYSEPEHCLIELLPNAGQKSAQDYALYEALQYIHHPPPDADVGLLEEGRHPAQRRLAFEELLAQQLSLMRLKTQFRAQTARPLDSAGSLFRELQSRLPFALTDAQRRVIDEIDRDLASSSPMQRLVQGDVGSGKTIVAAAACLRAVEKGQQAAVMAPTELLAEQHFRSFSQWLQPLGLNVCWLSGRQKAEARRNALELIDSGEAAVAIGTHALFQQGVRFKGLALIVIDEQHRFGVHQRLALKEKGAQGETCPHQLIMTATPIPRTLAMTAYADLDYSVIDELPPGRRPVNTVALPNSRRAEVIERVSKACAQGRQAYWVCTLIEESEVLQCQTAEDTASLLTRALSHLAIGLVHGRMSSQDKEAVMSAFKRGEIHLLVATTVIEVGVDVPNASLMIIENAERLGLAQLHQLRGRVGRGTTESNCVLMYQPPLSDGAKRRLQVLRKTTDGFEIAKADLDLRGPGEVLGTRQTGTLHFRVANIMRDQYLIPDVQKAAKRLLTEHPENVEPLIQRWVGDSIQYGQV
jgi:ATP-dependent DNA helicase RecG